MLSVATHVALGVEASQVSFFFFLYFAQMCGGLAQVIDGEKKGYAQEWKVKVMHIACNLNILAFLSFSSKDIAIK